MGNGTSIGRVRGLGSAHNGAHHWLLQRYTAIGNLLLVAYLLTSLALLPNYAFITVHDWVSRPVPATAIALLVISLFWHARLGLQVVIEDYVRNEFQRIAALLVVKGACALLALACGFSVLRIAFAL